MRFAVAKKIVERAADFGIPAHDIVVDPLVMPVGAMGSAGQQVFTLVRRLRDELGVNTTCGASNISFGLPHRHGINAAFLPMAIGAGMTSAIMNPVRSVEMEAIRAANFLMNHDANGGEWIRFAKVLEAVEGRRHLCRSQRRRCCCGRAWRTPRGSQPGLMHQPNHKLYANTRPFRRVSFLWQIECFAAFRPNPNPLRPNESGTPDLGTMTWGEPVFRAVWHMSKTSDINAIHILFYAEEAAARDKANGTYDANVKTDSSYYQWHGDQQLIPMGMDGEPVGFVKGLHKALPNVNTLRLSFNEHSFNKDGSLAPEYEAFLNAAAKQGFKLIMTYHDGDAQRLGNGDGLSQSQVYSALAGQVQDRMLSSWDSMMDWLDGHDAVAKAIYGYEMVNEPAAYKHGVRLSPQGQRVDAEQKFVSLYARNMAEVADEVSARDGHAKILVGGYGYSARFQELADTKVGKQSAIDYLRAEIGDKLVWSAHLYPGWHSGQDVKSPAALEKVFRSVFAPLGKDNILITETNLSGEQINNTDSAPTVVTHFARTQEWFAEKGIGITWFAGAEAGQSSFVAIDNGTDLRFLHQHSLAFGLNAFSLGDKPKEHRGDETVNVVSVAGKLRNEGYEVAQAAPQFDAARNVGTGFGYGGNDRINGNKNANNFLYGGTGQDHLNGAKHEDFLFGQYGDDRMAGRDGNDFLYGGDGNDLLRGGRGDDMLEGGAGC